jgi:[acyl-carrier-protein] S-malonyltransferase
MSLGLLFPGQGSQHPGMGKFLYNEFLVARETFEEGSDRLSINLKKLCFDSFESDLALTENTQPCLLLVSTVLHRVLKSLGPLPIKTTAGHSVGEYAAAVAAGTIDFSDALFAVRKRGEYMQSAVPVGKGGMVAAMGLTPDQAREVCIWAMNQSGNDLILEPANFNAPGQIVLSGSLKLIEWLTQNFDAEKISGAPKKVRFIPLKVSAPFHCRMMKPAEERMRPLLEEMTFAKAKFPIVQNVTATPEVDGAVIRENLIQQISASVLWVDCVEKVQSLGVKEALECGSGKVVSGLVKKIADDQLKVWNVNTLEELKAFESHLLNPKPSGDES